MVHGASTNSANTDELNYPCRIHFEIHTSVPETDAYVELNNGTKVPLRDYIPPIRCNDGTKAIILAARGLELACHKPGDTADEAALPASSLGTKRSHPDTLHSSGPPRHRVPPPAPASNPRNIMSRVTPSNASNSDTTKNAPIKPSVVPARPTLSRRPEPIARPGRYAAHSTNTQSGIVAMPSGRYSDAPAANLPSRYADDVENSPEVGAYEEEIPPAPEEEILNDVPSTEYDAPEYQDATPSAEGMSDEYINEEAEPANAYAETEEAYAPPQNVTSNVPRSRYGVAGNAKPAAATPYRTSGYGERRAHNDSINQSNQPVSHDYPEEEYYEDQPQPRTRSVSRQPLPRAPVRSAPTQRLSNPEDDGETDVAPETAESRAPAQPPAPPRSRYGVNPRATRAEARPVDPEPVAPQPNANPRSRYGVNPPGVARDERPPMTGNRGPPPPPPQSSRYPQAPVPRGRPVNSNKDLPPASPAPQSNPRSRYGQAPPPPPPRR